MHQATFRIQDPPDVGDWGPLGVPGPALSLRSQLSLDLIHGDDRLSLEDVVTRKHSYRMRLAERVKDDLLAAVAAAGDTAALLGQAAEVLVRWDNTVAPEARGGVLFEAWWRRYAGNGPEAPSPWARPWDRSAPTTTPDGLRDPTAAVQALITAAAATRRRGGTGAGSNEMEAPSWLRAGATSRVCES